MLEAGVQMRIPVLTSGANFGDSKRQGVHLLLDQVTYILSFVVTQYYLGHCSSYSAASVVTLKCPTLESYPHGCRGQSLGTTFPLPPQPWPLLLWRPR